MQRLRSLYLFLFIFNKFKLEIVVNKSKATSPDSDPNDPMTCLGLLVHHTVRDKGDAYRLYNE